MSGFITPVARISYPNLFTPSAAVEGAEEVYSAQLVFEEDTDISSLKQTIFKALRDEFGADEINDNAEVKSLETDHGPANFLVTQGGLRIRLPWRNDEAAISKRNYPDNSTFVNVKSKSPIAVVSQIPDPSNENKPAPIVNENGDIRFKDGTVSSGAVPIYPGRRVRASVNPYVYTQPANGVSLWFASGLQILGDADRFDDRAKAEDAFEADEDLTGDLSDLQEEAAATVGGGDNDDLSDLIGS